MQHYLHLVQNHVEKSYQNVAQEVYLWLRARLWLIPFISFGPGLIYAEIADIQGKSNLFLPTFSSQKIPLIINSFEIKTFFIPLIGINCRAVWIWIDTALIDQFGLDLELILNGFRLGFAFSNEFKSKFKNPNPCISTVQCATYFQLKDQEYRRHDSNSRELLDFSYFNKNIGPDWLKTSAQLRNISKLRNQKWCILRIDKKRIRPYFVKLGDRLLISVK